VGYITEFTPYHGAIGGALIGLSAVFFLWFNGRTAGISGIIHGLCPPKNNGSHWRLAFLIGLVIGGLSYFILPSVHFSLRSDFSKSILLIGGFLVGFGTRMGNGCTSGHGVCGIARFSKRSIVATLVFIVTAMVTVFIVRHLVGVD